MFCLDGLDATGAKINLSARMTSQSTSMRSKTGTWMGRGKNASADLGNIPHHRYREKRASEDEGLSFLRYDLCFPAAVAALPVIR